MTIFVKSVPFSKRLCVNFPKLSHLYAKVLKGLPLWKYSVNTNRTCTPISLIFPPITTV